MRTAIGFYSPSRSDIENWIERKMETIGFSFQSQSNMSYIYSNSYSSTVITIKQRRKSFYAIL